LLAEVLRHGVRKSKYDETNCSFLLPVWETIRRKADVVVWIEEFKVGHFQEAAVS
jgi:hypothetical protein